MPNQLDSNRNSFSVGQGHTHTTRDPTQKTTIRPVLLISLSMTIAILTDSFIWNSEATTQHDCGKIAVYLGEKAGVSASVDLIFQKWNFYSYFYSSHLWSQFLLLTIISNSVSHLFPDFASYYITIIRFHFINILLLSSTRLVQFASS